MQVEMKYLEEETARIIAAKSDQVQDTKDFERNVVTIFEWKMQLMKMDHDIALDFMQKEMAKSMKRTKDVEVEKFNLSKALEKATTEIKEDI